MGECILRKERVGVVLRQNGGKRSSYFSPAPHRQSGPPCCERAATSFVPMTRHDAAFLR